jgi:dephospho-CoA kinase
MVEMTTYDKKMKPYSVALTGGIGCGKTLVSDYFASLGVPVIDTDLISRELVTPGSFALDRIIAEFGKDMLQPDGQLDRKKLQTYIFKKPEAKKFIENLLHPLILQEVNQQKNTISAPYCIVVIPLLVESQMNFGVNRILVVDCSIELQKKRVLNRDKMTELIFDSIIDQQASRDERLAIADDIIVNNSDIEHVYSEVKLLHANYKRLASTISQ